MEEGPTYPVEPFLAYLRQEAASADAAWRRVAGDAPGEDAKMRLYLPTDRATPAALGLYALDLEVRRAVTILRQEFRTEQPRETVARTFPPIPVREGGLALKDAEFESADLLLVAFGAVSQVLLSDPVQLALTVKELLGWTGHLVVRVRKAFADREHEVFESKDGFHIKVGKTGVTVEGVPRGTHVSVEQRLSDGTETKIKVDRS